MTPGTGKPVKARLLAVESQRLPFPPMANAAQSVVLLVPPACSAGPTMVLQGSLRDFIWIQTFSWLCDTWNWDRSVNERNLNSENIRFLFWAYLRILALTHSLTLLSMPTCRCPPHTIWPEFLACLVKSFLAWPRRSVGRLLAALLGVS